MAGSLEPPDYVEFFNRQIARVFNHMEEHGWRCARCTAWGKPPALFRMTMRLGHLSLIICKSCGFHQEIDLRSGSAIYRTIGGEPEFVYVASHWAEHAYRFPPRCITQLRPAPERGLARFPFHASFGVGCPCGERAAYVLGHRCNSMGPSPVEIINDPLAIECPTCREVSELLDTRRHGYNGELDVIEGRYDPERDAGSTTSAEGERTRYACSACGIRSMLVYPTFSYQFDDEDCEKTSPQDFFDWYVLEGRCTGCGALRQITDFECA